MRYYSTQRPIAPGTFPKPEGNRIVELYNAGTKTFFGDGALYAWGYIDYEKPLTEKEAADYELTSERVASLNKAVSTYCRDFLNRSIYGECKAFCPFHKENNELDSIPMCSTHFIENHPDVVEKLLGMSAGGVSDEV